MVENGAFEYAGEKISDPNTLVKVREGAEFRAGRHRKGERDGREVRYGQNSRIDILLEHPARPPCYVEIKNVHLSRRAHLAEFPDCVTARGAKHLRELSAMVAAGHRAVMLYLVQRGDCRSFALAADIDPGYAAALERARAAGVETLCYQCNVKATGIALDRALPFDARTGTRT